MRALQRLNRKQRVIGMVDIAVKRKRLLIAVRGAQVIDEFDRRRLAQIIVETEGLEIIGIDAWHQSKFHTPAHNLINQRNLLGQTQRMIKRHHIAHRADAHAARVRARSDDVQTR